MNDLQLAELCRDAYNPDFSTNNQDWIAFFEPDGRVSGYWSHVHKIVLFLGSNDRLDWLRNMDRRIDRCTHAGFKRAFLGVRDTIGDYIEHDSGITVVGHSLGGALANLAMIEFFSKVSNCVTFGAPRVFACNAVCGCGGRDMAMKTSRYVFWDDPVAWVPYIKYKHVGDAIYLPWWPSSILSVKRHSINRYVKALQRKHGSVADA